MLGNWFCADGKAEAEVETDDDGWVTILAERSCPLAFGVLADASDLASGTPPPTRRLDPSSMYSNIHTVGM